MKTTLIVMAAGIGSRFGGLKQLQQVTDDGKCILDFSVFDAQKVGFNKVVFVLRKEIVNHFDELVGNRLKKLIDVDYVIQDDKLIPSCRKKPLGTAHAILCCKGVVKSPFVVINADDYYGPNAFVEVYNHLQKARKGQYCMTAYKLQNTLSKNGSVSRAVCDVHDGYLQGIREITNIDGNCQYEQHGSTQTLAPDTLVSMNLWGFTLDFFDFLEEQFAMFLNKANLQTDEFLLPNVIQKALQQKLANVKVYQTNDIWQGITYSADVEQTKQAIQRNVALGLYKNMPW